MDSKADLLNTHAYEALNRLIPHARQKHIKSNPAATKGANSSRNPQCQLTSTFRTTSFDTRSRAKASARSAATEEEQQVDLQLPTSDPDPPIWDFRLLAPELFRPDFELSPLLASPTDRRREPCRESGDTSLRRRKTTDLPAVGRAGRGRCRWRRAGHKSRNRARKDLAPSA